LADPASSREKRPMKRVEDILQQESLPANLEAERSLLGAILINNLLFEEVQETLAPEDFAFPAHQRVYRAMTELRTQNQPLDLVSLSERLHTSGLLEAAGGPEYIGALVSGLPRLNTVSHYARIIRDRGILRDLIGRASRIIADSYSSSEEPATILAQAEQSILEVGDRTLRSTLRGLNELAPSAAAMLDALIQRGEHVTGVSTRFSVLDEMTSGLQKSDFIILAARPSVGKTAFALSLALNVARQGKPVAFFSLEMSAEQLFFRLLSMASGVDLQQLRTGRVPRNKQAEVALKMDELATLPIYIDDSPLVTLLDMGAKLRRLKIHHPPELVIIDYLQLMRSVGRFENRNQEVSAISRGMKAMAKELSVPVVALSQLSRALEKRGEGKEPFLSDLRDSGSLEQDADLVLFLHRNTSASQEDPEIRSHAKLIVAKQRNGPTGVVELTFLQWRAQFADYHPGLGEGDPGV
jgi:replicative DNA helicase